jgi:pimeloyl-ACP methyl ester carboxylesterase
MTTLTQREEHDHAFSRPAFFQHYPFASHYFSTSQGKVHFVDEGHGEKVLLFVHGNPTWSYYFRELIGFFSARGYRCVALDHLGCGLSDKPLDRKALGKSLFVDPLKESEIYSLKQHRNRLVQLIEHLDLTKITLVAHDWGGAIGSAAAAECPERFEKTVYLNTAAFYFPSIPFSIRICRWPILGEWLVRGLNGFSQAARWRTTVSPLKSDSQAAYLYPFPDYDSRVAVARFVQDIPWEENHPTRILLNHTEEFLIHKKYPTLLFWGLQDFCFHEGFLKHWQKIIPTSEVQSFTDAGHYVLEEKASEIRIGLEQFLQNS